MKRSIDNLNNNVKLKDIAESTGYSVNTVSHALNDKDDISEATKKLIRDKANELGYIKNSAAGSLRSKKTKTIAAIVGDISNPFFGILVREIESFAKLRNYNTFIINSEEDPILEDAAVRSALEKNVDGIILCPTQKSENSIHLLRKLKFPFVLTGRIFNNIDCDYVVADDEKGGYIATKHLIEKGHRNILFLNGPEFIYSARLRQRGYESALAEYKIEYNPDLVKEVSITGNFSYFVKQISENGLDFSAVFAFSDMVAWEIIYTLKQFEYDVDKLDFVGFDNIQSNLLVPYPLTSVNYDKQKMARLAVEILLNRINGNQQDQKYKIQLDTELIVR